jgi:hypothetical protein
MKVDIFWDATPCGSYKNGVSEERSASIIRVTGIGEIVTAVTITSNRSTQRPHGITFQKTAFFIVIAVKTSNLT